MPSWIPNWASWKTESNYLNFLIPLIQIENWPNTVSKKKWIFLEILSLSIKVSKNINFWSECSFLPENQDRFRSTRTIDHLRTIIDYGRFFLMLNDGFFRSYFMFEEARFSASDRKKCASQTRICVAVFEVSLNIFIRWQPRHEICEEKTKFSICWKIADRR